MSGERDCLEASKALDITLLTRFDTKLLPRSSMRTPAHRSRLRQFPLTLLLLTMASSVAAQSSDPALQHARKLLESTPLIDGHNDLAWEIRESKDAPRDVAAYDIRRTAPKQTDLPRLKEGKVAAQFWSIYIPGEIKDSGYARVQLEQFDIARRMIAHYVRT